MAYNTPLQPHGPSRPLSRGELGLRIFFLVAIATFFSACKPEHIDEGTKLKYFDLKSYFKAEAARLQKAGKPVTKTVDHNKAKETKQVSIDKWETELSLFASSDINKPAWRDSYKVTDDGTIAIYEAKDPELKTREIIVNRPNNKVKWIVIYNGTKNMLYQTTEKLSYFPDSAYVINKLQQVRLLGTNQYVITGLLN